MSLMFVSFMYTLAWFYLYLSSLGLPSFLNLCIVIFHCFSEILSHYLFEYCFCPTISFLSLDSKYAIYVSMSSCFIIFVFHSFWSLHIGLSIFYWPAFQFTNLMFYCVWFAVKPLHWILHFRFCFFFSVLKCPSDFFIDSNSLFKFSIFSSIYPLFSLFHLTW